MVRTSTILLLLVLAGSSIVYAQQQPFHPTDSTAEYLGSFVLEWSVPTASSSLFSSTQTGSSSGSGCTVTDLVTAWRTGSGRIDYVLDAAQVIARGACSALDAITTQSVFESLSGRAVATGIALGYSTCAIVCNGAQHSFVFVANCVQRIGVGDSTHFEPCGADYAVRDYSICCPSGSSSASITLVDETGNSCQAPCEATTFPGVGGPDGLE